MSENNIYDDVALLQEQMLEVQQQIAELTPPVDTGWIDLPLSGTAVAYNDEQKPRYRKIGKTVFLSGVFKGVSESNYVIATLPEGFRPSKKVILPFASIGQKINRMEILTDGTIRYGRSTIEPTISENWHSIACDFSID